MAKTGSSALQVALSRNRETLAEHGVLYPTARNDKIANDGGVVTGNGVHLAPFLLSRAPSIDADPAGRAALNKMVGILNRAEFDTVLYSSELLYRSSADRLAALTARTTGWQPQAVLYVRDIAGHALSMYSQVCKRGRYTGTLDDYLGTADKPPKYELLLRDRISQMVNIFGKDNVTVLHYDTERTRLVDGFMHEVLGIPADSALDLTQGEINRSLTAHEVAIMRYANRRLKPVETAWLFSDQLISRPPVIPAPLALNPRQVEQLYDRFAGDVAWVNREFFGAEQLRVDVPGTMLEQTNNVVKLTKKERFLADCLVDTVRLVYREREQSAVPTTHARGVRLLRIGNLRRQLLDSARIRLRRHGTEPDP